MARRNGYDFGPYRHRKRLGWAWLLFFVSLFFLWVAFNALFMVPSEHPGQYDASLVSTAMVLIVVALLVAWASGRLFVAASYGSRNGYGSVLSTPPIMFCGGILLIFLGLLSSKLF